MKLSLALVLLGEASAAFVTIATIEYVSFYGADCTEGSGASLASAGEAKDGYCSKFELDLIGTPVSFRVSTAVPCASGNLIQVQLSGGGGDCPRNATDPGVYVAPANDKCINMVFEGGDGAQINGLFFQCT